jgi:threonine synthase
VFKTYRYLLDPHGAVAFDALQRYQQANPKEKGIILETAHPIKFLDVVEPVIGETIPVPPSIAGILSKEKSAIQIGNDYAALKDYLVSGR